MSVFLGAASLQGNTVQITAPIGFDSVNMVRLTNYTGDVLLISGISGEGVSVEYLMPLQQMVYETKNVSRAPTVAGLALGSQFNNAALFVEWSDDGLHDFTGTYPAQITQVQVSQSPAFASVNSLTLAALATTYPIPANPQRSSLTIINSDAAALVQWAVTDTNWANNPAIAPGSGRSLESTTAVYLRTSVAGSKVEWFED